MVEWWSWDSEEGSLLAECLRGLERCWCSALEKEKVALGLGKRQQHMYPGTFPTEIRKSACS